MNIPEMIKEARNNAIERGFCACPICESNKNLEGYPDPDCDNCKGTGIDHKVNIGEVLAMIAGELVGEALEAHRCGKMAEWPIVCGSNNFKDSESNYLDPLYFKMFLKDTFEDEISDAFIRLLNFCGYKGLNPDPEYCRCIEFTDNTAENLGKLSHVVLSYGTQPENWASYILTSLIAFCKIHNTDIEKHIKAKMAYNRTRPHKHGKEY